MYFNCAMQSLDHSHSRYTTSWLHLCIPHPPPTVHMAQMWGGCVRACLLIHLDVCCQSAGRPSIYCKSCSVFKAKINKHSVSQPKPQQHKCRSCQQEPLAKCKLAALPFCVQQQTSHAVWSSGRPRSSVSLG